MNIYEVTEIENKIDEVARNNDGEVPEEFIQELVEAQTKSIQQIEKLVKFVNYLDNCVINSCNAELERLKKRKEQAINAVANIKKYLTPYVKEKGRFFAGNYQLSTRKTESVEVINEDLIPDELMRIKVDKKPDKIAIKKKLKDGEYVSGVQLVTGDSLFIN